MATRAFCSLQKSVAPVKKKSPGLRNVQRPENPSRITSWEGCLAVNEVTRCSRGSHAPTRGAGSPHSDRVGAMASSSVTRRRRPATVRHRVPDGARGTKIAHAVRWSWALHGGRAAAVAVRRGAAADWTAVRGGRRCAMEQLSRRARAAECWSPRRARHRCRPGCSARIERQDVEFGDRGDPAGRRQAADAGGSRPLASSWSRSPASIWIKIASVVAVGRGDGPDGEQRGEDVELGDAFDVGHGDPARSRPQGRLTEDGDGATNPGHARAGCRGPSSEPLPARMMSDRTFSIRGDRSV